MSQRKIDGFILEEAVVGCPECQQPFTTEIVVESRKVNTNDTIEADLHRVFKDAELRSALLSCCPVCKYSAWTSGFKPFRLKPELLRRETKIEPSKKYALAVKWARQKKVHSLDIAFIALNGLWCAREAGEADSLWLELAIYEHEKGVSGSKQRLCDDGMTHLIMGELYRQYRNFDKAVSEYELAAEDRTVSKEILSHLTMMANRGFSEALALPLRLARLYFEIEEATEPPMDFAPAKGTAKDSAPVKDNAPVTQAELPSDLAADEPKIKVDLKFDAGESKAAPTSFSTEEATSKEPASAPILAAINTLFSTDSKKSFLDAYANIDLESDEEVPVVEHAAETVSASATDESKETETLSSLSDELTRAASPVTETKQAVNEAAAPVVAPSAAAAAAPLAAAPAPVEPIAAAKTGAAPLAESAAAVEESDEIAGSQKSKKIHPTAEVIPPLAVADPDAEIRAAERAKAAQAPAPIASPVIRPATLPMPIVRPGGFNPNPMRPAAYSAPYMNGTSAPLQIQSVAAAPAPIVVPSEAAEEFAPYLPGAETTKVDDSASGASKAINTPAESHSSVSISMSISSANAAHSPAPVSAAPQKRSEEISSRMPETEVAIPQPISEEQAEIREEKAAEAAQAAGAKPPSPTRKRSRKQKPSRDDHYFSRRPVAMNQTPNHYGWVNDYGNSVEIKDLVQKYTGNSSTSAPSQPAQQQEVQPVAAAASKSTSVVEEKVETKQKAGAEQRVQTQVKAENHQPRQQQQQQAPQTEADGAPLPGLAIDDPVKGKDFTDAINRVESYLSFSRRVYSSRNFSNL